MTTHEYENLVPGKSIIKITATAEELNNIYIFTLATTFIGRTFVVDSKEIIYDKRRIRFKYEGQTYFVYPEHCELTNNTMNLTVTKENVLKAASACPTAKATLEKLFPEVFEQPKPKYPLKVGDVYVHPYGNIYAFRLEQCCYDDSKSYQLFGMGCKVNSDDFFTKLHTLDEISAYLAKNDMVYSHNVQEGYYNGRIYDLYKKV